MERRQDDKQIGYMTAKLEEVLDLAKSHETRLDVLEKNIAEKFTTVETVFKILKFTGLAIAAVLTFKFGDVAQLWQTLVK